MLVSMFELVQRELWSPLTNEEGLVNPATRARGSTWGGFVREARAVVSETR